jgi:hypothetical protein
MPLIAISLHGNIRVLASNAQLLLVNLPAFLVLLFKRVRMMIMIISCSGVLPEKLIISQLVKKFPAFYGTRSFITVLIKSHLWTLSRVI